VGPQLPPQQPITTLIHLLTYVYIFKLPREKGKEWDHVTTIGLKDKHQHKVGTSTASMSLCFPHQRALTSHESSLWGSKVHCR